MPDLILDASDGQTIVLEVPAQVQINLDGGLRGSQGEKGDDGTAATVGVGVVSTGLPSTPASVTNTGTSTAAVLDFLIPKGDPGDAATIAVGTVTTVDPTDPATVTNVGTSSAAIFDFEIPQGVPGAGGGSGDVIGPGSSINNDIPRWDGTDGTVIQGSGVGISDPFTENGKTTYEIGPLDNQSLKLSSYSTGYSTEAAITLGDHASLAGSANIRLYAGDDIGISSDDNITFSADNIILSATGGGVTVNDWLAVDTIYEKTASNGVEIEQIILKDGDIVSSGGGFDIHSANVVGAGDSSSVSLSSGNAPSGNSGSVFIYAGEGSGTDGNVVIGNPGMVLIQKLGSSIEGTLSMQSLTADRTFTYPDAATTLVGHDTTQTLTNKRVTPRAYSASLAGTTFTPDIDTYDSFAVNEILGASLTIANPTGTPTNMQKALFKFDDGGTAKALTWGAIYRAIGVTLPTTTVANKILYIGAVYNAWDTKWDVVAVSQEV